MKIKTLILAALLTIGFPLAAKAEGIESKNESVCGAECSQLNVYQTNDSAVDLAEGESKVAQRTRIRRTRSSGSDFKKIYAGGTLGIFLPSDLDELDDSVVTGFDSSESIELNTGFGGSIYGGYRLNQSLSADAEFFIFGGGSDPIDDAGYTALGFFLNPRFTYTFNKNSSKSFYAFASPGLGVVNLSLNDEIDDRTNGDTSGSGFALQAKAGVGYPITETIDLIGQARYFRAFKVFEIIGGDDDQGFGALGLELGANFKF